MDELVQAMSDFSLELMPTGYLKPPPSGIHPIKQPIKFREGIWNRITQVMYPSDSPLYNWWSPFNSDTDDHRDATFMDSVSDTWVVPLVQFAHCHIRQDEVCIINCFRSMKAGGLLQLASAYLNLAVPFKRELMRAPTVNLEIFTASPEANGFFGAKGISGFVPKAYSLVMSQIWKQLCSRDQGSDAGPHRQILEYRRDTWQFHAKGIWYTPPRESFPVMTAVGSPNFGHRSVYRDIESQVLLFTANPDLQKRLQVEAQSLLEHCHPVQEEKIVELRRQTGAAVKLAVKLVKGFL